VTEAVAIADGQIRQFNGLDWTPVPTGWTPTEPVKRGTLMLSARAYWAMPEIPDGHSVSVHLGVPGVTPDTGWVFEVTSIHSARLAVQAKVTAENVVTLTATNTTGASVRLAACTWRVYGWR